MLQNPPEPFAVQPQRELEEARKRLDEKAKRAAKQLLDKTNLPLEGTELTYKYKVTNATGKNNYTSAIIMVNLEISKTLGKERKDASSEEFKQMSDGLDDIIKTLVKRTEKARLEADRLSVFYGGIYSVDAPCKQAREDSSDGRSGHYHWSVLAT